MAEKAKPPIKNSKRLAMIKKRNKDVYETHGADIRKNGILRFGAGVFQEQRDLIIMIDALTGGDAKNLDSVPIEWPEEKESDSIPETDE